MGNKGGNFEREICKRLSVWWTGKDEEDDVFWRTSTSGARATSRRKRGRDTRGQSGDVCATHPSGQALTNMVAIELKRGYSSKSITCLFDRRASSPFSQYEDFIQQAREAATNEESLSWMLIVRRDKAEEMVYFPLALYTMLKQNGAFETDPRPFVSMRVRCRTRQEVKRVKTKKKNGKGFTVKIVYKIDGEVPLTIVGMTLNTFLKKVNQDTVRRVVRNHYG